MSLQEYDDALSAGYEFLNNHNQLLHSLKLSRIHADNHSYTEKTQGIGNESVQPSEGVGEPSDGSVA